MKKAASLCLEGATISEIANELNVSQSTVRRLLKASKGLPSRCLSETAQVVRWIELERLNKLKGEFFLMAKGMGEGVPFNQAASATRLFLDLMDRHMRLLSYEDSPPISGRKIRAFVDSLAPSFPNYYFGVEK